MSAATTATKPEDAVLILGALSGVGRALARVYAKAGHPLILAARRAERLEGDVTDLTLRYGVGVQAVEFDVLDTGAHAGFVDRLGSVPGIAICVVGLLGRQEAAEHDWAHAELILRSNYVGPACVLGEIANRMEARGSGCIIGVGSVAGDRGRASNYFYGSAKSGFAAFLSGLRNRLSRAGVRVMAVKPGYIDTAMTRGMKLPKALTAQPEEIAEGIRAAQIRGCDVVYLRPIWRWIMLVIRLIPERVFKRLKL